MGCSKSKYQECVHDDAKSTGEGNKVTQEQEQNNTAKNEEIKTKFTKKESIERGALYANHVTPLEAKSNANANSKLEEKKSTTDYHTTTITATTAAPTTITPNKNEMTEPTVKIASRFQDEYRLGKTIGSGTFSVVREGFHKKSNQKFAIKCIKRDGLSAEDIEALTAEVAILKQMNHPNIMILHDFFAEEKYYYLVTEFMEGGELFDRIVEKSYYSEREARDLVKLLLEAISYCHKNNVVHRDLKPENLLLTRKDDNASIKIADFGFAKKIDFGGEGLSTACGTPGYVAPEILQGKAYGKAVDIWSIGVITYILLCGYPPFHDENHNALFRKIKKGKYEFDSPYWDHISVDAKDLISRMLVTSPDERAGADELLHHPWLCGNEIATVQLTSALEELRRFNARRRFKAAVNTVQAANLLRQLTSGGNSPREHARERTSSASGPTQPTAESSVSVESKPVDTSIPIEIQEIEMKPIDSTVTAVPPLNDESNVVEQTRSTEPEQDGDSRTAEKVDNA